MLLWWKHAMSPLLPWNKSQSPVWSLLNSLSDLISHSTPFSAFQSQRPPCSPSIPQVYHLGTWFWLSLCLGLSWPAPLPCGRSITDRSKLHKKRSLKQTTYYLSSVGHKPGCSISWVFRLSPPKASSSGCFCLLLGFGWIQSPLGLWGAVSGKLIYFLKTVPCPSYASPWAPWCWFGMRARQRLDTSIH